MGFNHMNQTGTLASISDHNPKCFQQRKQQHSILSYKPMISLMTVCLTLFFILLSLHG